MLIIFFVVFFAVIGIAWCMGPEYIERGRDGLGETVLTAILIAGAFSFIISMTTDSETNVSENETTEPKE